jgi:hypothetical protein
LFVDDLPTHSSEGRDIGDALGQLAVHDRIQSVPLRELARLVKEMSFYEIEAEDEQPYLRHYHDATFSRFAQQEPSGFLGPVRLLF